MIKLATIAFLSTAFLANRSAHAHYQCYNRGSQYVNSHRLDISYNCCYDNMLMYDRNGHHLENQLTTCAQSIMDDVTYFMGDHCNRDATQCTIDYHDFSCDNDFARTCRLYGGLVVESDVYIECRMMRDKMEMTFRNKIDCISPVCTDGELFQVLEAAADNVAGLGSGSCEVVSVRDVFVEGRESVYELSSNSSDDTSNAVVIAVVVVVVVLCLALGILIFLLLRKRQNVDRSTQAKQVTPITHEKSTPAATSGDSNQSPVAVIVEEGNNNY